MTAINGLANESGAYLMTDSASYDASTGEITGFASKARTFPHLSMAMAVTGTGMNERELAFRMRQFNSFDEAAAGLSEMVRGAWEEGALDVGDDELSHVRLMLAGWSQANKRGEMYCVSTSNEEGGEAFTLFKRGFMASPAAMSLDAMRAAGFLKGNDQALTVDDPVDFLTQTIDYQRTLPWPVPGRAESIKYIVGGSAILTVINAAGIVQRVVKQWPDKLHTTIDPTGDVGVSQPVTPPPRQLSRQERRAAEARKRRVA
jgi:hypothetical protein